MGFNTTVVVLNDALPYIEEDPEFGKKLARAISEASLGHKVDVRASNGMVSHGNAAQVIETHHADGTAVVAVGGNMGVKLGSAFVGYSDDYNVDVLRALADQMGYRISKKPERK